MFCYILLLNYKAPSGAPPDPSVIDVAPTTATCKWNSLPCEEQNGPIRLYEVQVEELTTVTRKLYYKFVNLTPFTEYTWSVQAKNDVGYGPRTTGISFTTNKTGKVV